MPTEQDIRSAFHAAVGAVARANRQRMLTGRKLTDGSVTLYSSDPAVTSDNACPVGMVWVRGEENSREKTAVWGSAGKVNATVWVVRAPDDSWVIEGQQGVDWQATVATHGQGARLTPQPVGFEELAAQNVPDLGFKPGRLGVSSSGGTYVHVEPFEYDGGRWSGSPDLDVGSYYPALPSMYGRIGVYFDPTDGALHAFAGETSFTPTVWSDTDRSLVPAGVYPVGEVTVLCGASITASNEFIDWRLHHAQAGYLLTGGSAARSVASGALTIGRESVVIVSAETGTADDIDTITLEGAPRKIIFIAASGHTLTFKHATDNISLNSAGDIDVADGVALELYCDGSTAQDTAAIPPIPTIPAHEVFSSVAGTLAVSTQPLRLYNTSGAARTITKVFISVNTAPTDASLIVDVLNNGTTIFTGGARSSSHFID